MAYSYIYKHMFSQSNSSSQIKINGKEGLLHLHISKDKNNDCILIIVRTQVIYKNFQHNYVILRTKTLSNKVLILSSLNGFILWYKIISNFQ